MSDQAARALRERDRRDSDARIWKATALAYGRRMGILQRILKQQNVDHVLMQQALMMIADGPAGLARKPAHQVAREALDAVTARRMKDAPKVERLKRLLGADHAAV